MPTSPRRAPQPGQRDHQLHGRSGALLVYFGGKPLYDRRPSLPFLVGRAGDARRLPAVVLLIASRPWPARGGASRWPLLARPAGQPPGRFPPGEEPAGHPAGHPVLFVGFNAIETFFTTTPSTTWDEESTGALILGFFSVTFMAGSLGAASWPSAWAPAHHPHRLLVVCATMLLRWY